MNDWFFRHYTVINWTFHRLLLDQRIPVFLCSTTGVVLHVSSRLLTYVAATSDVRATEGEIFTFDPIRSAFDVQRRVYMTTADTFRYVDTDTGLVRLNKTAALDEYDIGESEVENWRVGWATAWKRFSGWATCLDVSDVPKTARDFLDFIAFGKEESDAIDARPKRSRGRPTQREDAARIYYQEFPQGHEQEGKTWKEAVRTVNQHLPRPIVEDTLKRALEAWTQKSY